MDIFFLYILIEKTYQIKKKDSKSKNLHPFIGTK